MPLNQTKSNLHCTRNAYSPVWFTLLQPRLNCASHYQSIANFLTLSGDLFHPPFTPNKVPSDDCISYFLFDATDL